MKIYIYKLMDPDTLEVRYIGKTGNVKNRYSSHISNSKKLKTKLANWIKHLIKFNKLPIIEIVEECTKESWEQREIYWINHYKSKKLCNHHPGGKLSCIPTNRPNCKKYDFHNNNYRVRCSYLNTVYYIGEFKSIKEAIQAYDNFYNSPEIWIKQNKNQDFREKQKKSVIVYKDNIKINEFKSVAECASFYNIDSANIATCCRGKLKTYKGMIFKYK